MGIMVGRNRTYVLCDKTGCRNESTGNHDQHKAWEDAEKEGWWISCTNGFALCPKCRGW